MSDGFLGRWSRRKQASRLAGGPAPEPTPPAGAAPPAPPPAAAPDAGPVTAAPPPAPTLEEAQALTPADDFSRFAARNVSPEVRNLAMKQLFRDPHFNRMDGLDTYIDDYSVADPMPLATVRKLASARFLGWGEEQQEPKEALAAPAAEAADTPPTDPAAPDVAQLPGSPPGCREADDPSAPVHTTASQTPYADPHLRLQPDHAPPDFGPGGSGRRAP
ncbi:MAG: hypothetical protein ABS38_03375 [Acidovorax sp. SCN 68-22]|nr:MAG: hypothetical protein ABS38_03375 [Acidovorax sp. SCN 68-22]